ncbi:MAG: hypothetical protein ABL872_12175 [Lacibacter sp.]
MNDNHLQQLLLQTEVAPPPQAWEMIAVALDELEEDKPLQQKILSAETEVPVFNWEIIEQQLDDVYYTEQLEAATAEVPVTAWENITAQLDEEADQRLADKLIAAKEIPPVAVWTAIEKELNEEQTGKIIPFTKKLAPVYRLAAAALITGILAWGAYSLLNSNEPVASTVAVSQPVLTEEKKTAPVAEIKTEEPVETIIPVSSSRSSVKKRIKEALTVNNTLAYLEPVNHDAGTSSSFKDTHNKKIKPVAEINGFSEGQYLIVLNEEGNLIRVSKKLSNLQCAVDAAGNPVDAAAALQSKNCDEQIRIWQQKIAVSTAISPSAGYIDLAELLMATEK